MGNEKAGAVKSDHGREARHTEAESEGECGNQETRETSHAVHAGSVRCEQAGFGYKPLMQRSTSNIQR